jgi:TRAP-type C4-dicarboxylate transport system permease small subunit
LKTISTYAAGLFFLVFAVVHLIRIVQGWEVSFGGTFVPMAVSYVALPVSAALAYGLLKSNKKKE